MCALVAPALAPLLVTTDAAACGGCFHEPINLQVSASVVTDHRMAFALSPQQTVLWDQIRYSGAPSNFAWVLPVKPGARIEASTDAWLAALDASTQTVIVGPTVSCGGPPQVERESSGGGGCGSSFSSAGSAVATDEDGGAADSATMPAVEVISQQVVGPHDAVTVRSSQGEALGTWLVANGYEIPGGMQPTIDAYASEGFDFIALKLAPGEGVQAMQPVRVVTPGADPSLPLRMVSAGVGSHVGLELFVLSGGRYETQNFPGATIDFTRLQWNPYLDVSNYSTLAAQAMGASGGTAWLTEYSGPASMSLFPGIQANPGLAYAYTSTCVPSAPSCPISAADGGTSATPEAGPGAESGASIDSGGVADSGPDAAAFDDSGLLADGALVDALVPDADPGDGASNEPSVDAGASADAALPPAPPPMCAAPVTCDDLALATTGLSAGTVWVTRLRADLPSGALANDLVLEASASQTTVTNLHTTETYTDPNLQPLRDRRLLRQRRKRRRRATTRLRAARAARRTPRATAT